MASFDLFRNPFVVLRLDLTATAEEVADAFEDAVADGVSSQSQLTAARQAILVPLLRLEAEVGSLLDTPQSEWRPILTALRSSQGLAELRQAFANVPSLSRSNVLAHLASREAPDGSTLIDWVAAQSAIKSDTIQQEVERIRKTAGVVRPDRTALLSTLSDLRERQSRALFDSFASPSEAIEVVTDCTRTIISIGNEAHIDVLSNLLSAYNRHIDQELSFRRERITLTANALRSDPDGSGNLAVVLDAVRFWNLAAQPLQLFEAHKSRTEPNAQEVFQEIRNLAIDFANSLSRFDLALSITKACKEIFSNLPRAVQQLTEDQAALEERVVTAKVEPLAVAIGKFNNDLRNLASDLRKDGFGRAAAGNAKALRDAFVIAVKSSKGSTVADLPWLMVRSIVVTLNNELESPDSALALMKGLLELARELGTSDDIAARLREDKRAIERNQLEKELLAHLKDGRLGAASSVIGNLLQDYKSPEERATLQKLQSDVGRRKVGRYVRWGFWPAIVLAGFVVSNLDRSPSPRSPPSPPFSPSPSPSPGVPAPPPQPIPSSVEEMPPVGTDRVFSEANIRYCTFRNARLDYMKSRVSTDFEIDKFNRSISDYNSRCGSYRYRSAERVRVESELTFKQTELEAEARRELNSWRAQQIVPQAPTPSIPSIGTTLPPAPSSAPPPPATVAPTTEPSDRPSLDLLKLADASRVQTRLVELGFSKGPADGTWGPQSRSALRAFRVANGLPASDAWDTSAAEKLFSTDAMRSSGAIVPQGTLPDAIYAPPIDATLHPLNKDDAIRIHTKLRDLGLYQGKNNVVWSLNSRAALREFKKRNGLPLDDEWDAATENQLFNPVLPRPEETDEARFSASFSGTWAADVRACGGSGTDSDAIPLTITRRRAEAGGSHCDFQDVKSDGERWLVKAQCQGDGRSWVANITLSRSGDQIRWSSERGTTAYHRCGS